MQIQPKSEETKRGRAQRELQAARGREDAFRGGQEAPRPRLALKAPWMMGTSRLFEARDSGPERD